MSFSDVYMAESAPGFRESLAWQRYLQASIRNHASCRVFHRGVLQVVDKTLGISLSECHCLPKHAPHAIAKTGLMTILQHTYTQHASQWPEGIYLVLQSIRYSCFTSCWW